MPTLRAATPAVWHRVMDGEPDRAMDADRRSRHRQSASGREPRIVSIGSHAGFRAEGTIPNATAQAALAIADATAGVVASPAIGSAALAPGLVDTPMSAGWKASYEAMEHQGADEALGAGEHRRSGGSVVRQQLRCRWWS